MTRSPSSLKSPAKARTQFEDFWLHQARSFRPARAEFLKLQLYQTKGFVSCPGRENILKPNASLLLFYRTSQVPAKGAAQAAPLTPPGSSFSC